MQDAELFELLNFLPQDAGWAQQFYRRDLQGLCKDKPRSHWCQWAKDFLLQPSTDREGLDILLRLLTLAESLYPGGMERARLQESLGYLFSHLKGPYGLSRHPLVCLEAALRDSLVRQDKIDLWNPGMSSGSGWRTFYRLTLLGKSKVDISDMPPMDKEPATPYIPRAQRCPVATPPPTLKPPAQSPSVPPWRRHLQPPAPAPEPAKQSSDPRPLPTDFVWARHYVDQQVSRFFKHHVVAYSDRVKAVLNGTCDLKTFSDEFGPAQICRWINDKHAVGPDHPNPCKPQNINTSATYEACVKSFKRNPQGHAVAKQLYKSESAQIDAILQDLLGTEDIAE